MSEETTTDISTSGVQQEAAKPETFSLDYVQGLRQEAAKYRTEKNDAVAAAKAELAANFDRAIAEKDTEFEALKADVSARELELIKLRAVLSAGIPSEDVLEVVTLVQGNDEIEISDSVNRVKALIGKNPPKDRPVDPSQGSSNTIPLNGDPLLESLKKIVGHR
jgi:hypothetical protein